MPNVLAVTLEDAVHLMRMELHRPVQVVLQ